ncbi:hypothetical protein BU25DRAFT_475848 [Macroventuria anomochaeta]|uniref:Uncharacterized protein n=1 Tax=Macroventuria anomochaeta TaxID=301207 RepID=A0ACB6SDJ9_9PLEO|nr:uncharacterized protein BU25DRAFT_475848 [Macroventuria anomochaeta]KAF2632360.1 hypothetical protein BU25DRAFT_475848 [Macroventuria anomochaeta]
MHSLLSLQAVDIVDNILDPNASNYMAKMDIPARPTDLENFTAEATEERGKVAYASRVVAFKLQSGEQVSQNQISLPS